MTLKTTQYLIYDGTYFHKDGCLIILMNSIGQTITDFLYTAKEGSLFVKMWFKELKARGLEPLYITMDEEKNTTKMLRSLWPGLNVQRCLYHIQREGMRWLRSYPKTEAGKALRAILSQLCAIKSVKEQNVFMKSFKNWLYAYRDFVLSLPMNVKVNFDLKRTISLIQNASPDMFHYLMDPHIPSTSNALEGFFSRLKSAYRQHRGLSQLNKIRFLKWFCYFENQQKINN